MKNINLDIIKWILEENRIPQNFLLTENWGKSEITKDMLRDISSELSPEITKKLEKYKQKLDRKSVILTGTDSFSKDLVAVLLLLSYAYQNKKVMYYSHPNYEELNPAWVTAIMRVELVEGRHKATKLAKVLAEIITAGGVFIISCDSIKSLKNIFESSFGNFLINQSVEIVILENKNERIQI